MGTSKNDKLPETFKAIEDTERTIQIREVLKKSLFTNPIFLGILKSTGNYEKILENVPHAIDVLLQDARGTAVLFNMGILDYIDDENR